MACCVPPVHGPGHEHSTLGDAYWGGGMVVIWLKLNVLQAYLEKETLVHYLIESS